MNVSLAEVETSRNTSSRANADKVVRKQSFSLATIVKKIKYKIDLACN